MKENISKACIIYDAKLPKENRKVKMMSKWCLNMVKF